MAKKKQKKDGPRSVLVDGKDRKRIEELQQQQTALRTAMQANGQTMQFIFKAYSKKNERFVNYNMDTGLVTFQKQAKPPKAVEPPKKKEE